MEQFEQLVRLIKEQPSAVVAAFLAVMWWFARKDLRDALKHHRRLMMAKRRDDTLGDFLQITPEQRDTVVNIQKNGDSRLFGELLVDLGYAKKADVDKALSMQLDKRKKVK